MCLRKFERPGESLTSQAKLFVDTSACRCVHRNHTKLCSIQAMCVCILNKQYWRKELEPFTLLRNERQLRAVNGSFFIQNVKKKQRKPCVFSTRINPKKSFCWVTLKNTEGDNQIRWLDNARKKLFRFFHFTRIYAVNDTRNGPRFVPHIKFNQTDCTAIVRQVMFSRVDRRWTLGQLNELSKTWQLFSSVYSKHARAAEIHFRAIWRRCLPTAHTHNVCEMGECDVLRNHPKRASHSELNFPSACSKIGNAYV